MHACSRTLFSAGFSANLLGKDAGAKRALAVADNSPLAIIQHPEIAKAVEQLVMTEQVVRIPWLADRLLINQIGVKNNKAADFERGFHCREQRALKIANIHDEIVSGRFGSVIFQVGLPPRDRERLLQRSLLGAPQGNG